MSFFPLFDIIQNGNKSILYITKAQQFLLEFDAYTDASALNGCKKLQKLHMNECSSLKSIGTLAGLNDLEELSFNRYEYFC